MAPMESGSANTFHGRGVVLGLDGATFDLLDPLMASGVMPHLKGICGSGRRAILKSTKPPITACAWPTMYTGSEPGRHSIFDFRRPLRDPDLKRRFVNSSSIRLPKIWEVLAEEGQASILLNLPLTFPPFEMNGRLISGMPLPSGARDITYPKGLLDEIEKECGGYIADIDFLRGDIPDISNEEALRQLLGQLHKALEFRLRAAQYLIAHGEWRMFFACFILPDRVQHLYYQILDEKCLQGKKLDKHEENLREKLIALYGELDDAIGSIVKSLNPEDCLLLLSDHGFGPLKRMFHLNLWLQEKGYLKFNGSKGKGSSGVKRFIPESVKRPLRALLRKKPDMAGYNPLALIDWGATRAYCGSSSEQGVYLNVKGREPYGVVEQGLEYTQLRDRLMKELEGAKDPATGERIFEVVCPREEIQSGRFIENAPDIYIQPTRYEWVMAEEHVGEMSMPWHHTWGGFHREEGIFVAAGPMISRGGEFSQIEMTQVMPFILASLGMPIPDWVDANPPDGLLGEEFARAHPIVRKGYPELLGKYEGDLPIESGDTGGDDLLKGLGYIN